VIPKKPWINAKTIEKYASLKCHFTEIFIFPFRLNKAIKAVIINIIIVIIPRYIIKGNPKIR
jgi:hypothetical protein